MKVTAFIRKTAKKNDVDTKATIYFRLRDGKKDIKAASELVISPNHWSADRQGYKDRVALVAENEKMDLNHKCSHFHNLQFNFWIEHCKVSKLFPNCSQLSRNNFNLIKFNSIQCCL